QRQRGLVVLARGPELAELPERLREAVLRLGVGTQLEQQLVRLGALGPLGRRRLRDRLVDQLSLQADLVDGGRRLVLEIREGDEAVVLSVRARPLGPTRWCPAGTAAGGHRSR